MAIAFGDRHNSQFLMLVFDFREFKPYNQTPIEGLPIDLYRRARRVEGSPYGESITFSGPEALCADYRYRSENFNFVDSSTTISSGDKVTFGLKTEVYGPGIELVVFVAFIDSNYRARVSNVEISSLPAPVLKGKGSRGEDLYECELKILPEGGDEMETAIMELAVLPYDPRNLIKQPMDMLPYFRSVARSGYQVQLFDLTVRKADEPYELPKNQLVLEGFAFYKAHETATKNEAPNQNVKGWAGILLEWYKANDAGNPFPYSKNASRDLDMRGQNLLFEDFHGIQNTLIRLPEAGEYVISFTGYVGVLETFASKAELGYEVRLVLNAHEVASTPSGLTTGETIILEDDDSRPSDQIAAGTISPSDPMPDAADQFKDTDFQKSLKGELIDESLQFRLGEATTIAIETLFSDASGERIDPASEDFDGLLSGLVRIEKIRGGS